MKNKLLEPIFGANIHWQRSLKTRVTLFTLAIFVVSLWVLALYTGRMLREDMQRVLGEQQFRTASRVAAEIDDHLIDRMAALELVAKEIDAHLIGNPTALQARVWQRPLLSIMFNRGTWVSGQDGIVIASNLPVLNGTNYANREYLITVLKDGKSAISKPITGKVLKDPIFVMAVPIRDAAGRVIGAIAGVTDLSKANFLDRSAKGEYGKSGGFLLNAPQYRLIITATDKTRIMQPLPPLGVNTMLDRFIQGYEGYGVSVNSRGVEELTAAKGIPLAGWFMGVVMPTAEAFAPVYDMQQRMLLATLLLTLLAGGLTWWMLKRQLAPMLAAAKTLSAQADSGLVAQPLPISQQDEVGDLISGFNRLLTVAQQREKALHNSEQQLAEAQSLAKIGSWQVVFDQDEAQDHWTISNEIRTLYEHPDNLKIDTGIGFALMPAQDQEVTRRAWAAAKTGQGPTEWLHRICVNGKVKWMQVTAKFVFDEQGRALRASGTNQDITDRKQTEEALQQKTQALERSNAELEQFAYVASHDLRQPLRMVNSYMQLLERALADKLDNKTREMMHFATDGAKRMDQMLVSLLEYSRVVRKGEPLAPMSSRDAVDEALHFLAPALQEAHAKVRVSGNWPQVLASRDEFTRLWQNLIGNAVKYRTPERPPEIDITVTPEAAGWRFCVTDNGIGIDPAQFERLFKVFQRLHSRDQYEGNGIGLAVARKIVERLGGRIWVESDGEGLGSRFCFSLPARPVETSA